MKCLVLASAFVLCGCGSHASAPAATTYTFDLARYEASGLPLSEMGATLVFPVVTDRSVSTPTRADSGDFVAAYTRLGCGIDVAIVESALAPTHVRSVASVPLTKITVQYVSNQYQDAGDSAKRSCFTYRDRTGHWHAQIPPSRVVESEGTATAEIDLDSVEADAVAVFTDHYRAPITQTTYAVAVR